MYQFLCGYRFRNARPNCLATALVVNLFAMILPTTASAAEPLGTAMTLPAAVEMTLNQNPELQVYRLRDIGLAGLEKTAGLSPQFGVSAEAENFAGTGDVEGVDAAELTLALSSVIELGEKRQARVAAASAQRQVIDSERQARALDLIGEVTRRFVDVVANQARLDLAISARALATDVLKSVERRIEAGAAPEAERFRANAQLTQSELSVKEAQSRLRTSVLSLSVLWGDAEPDFVRVEGSLGNPGSTGDFNELYERALRNPAIELFASEERLREAELQLARSQSSADVGWSVGVRQFQDTDDTALVAGVSVPLFSSHRNAGALQSAQAARDEVTVQRESALLGLRATLFDAYQQRKLGIESAALLDAEVIPALTRALQLTQAAYENGRYGYQEWMAARQELISAQSALINAQADALQSGATIEQLTAEPLLSPLAPDASGTEQESEQ
jgi:cobalt-zinc-cadmium efflux system outer membrane protein